MNKQYALTLYAAFPMLYRSFYQPITKTFLRESLDCGDGWFELLMQLSADIENLAHQEGRNASNWPAAQNVKEKYGTLRFEVCGGSQAMLDLTYAAERKSGKVCEECGNCGEVYDDYRIKTQCIPCRNGKGLVKLNTQQLNWVI
jgi:hypothetical protein